MTMRITALKQTLGAVVLVAATTLVAGCGGDTASEKLAEKAIEDSSGDDVDVDIDDDEVTVESEDGTVKFGSGEVPENFPSDLEIPDGEVVSSVETPEGSMLSITVDDPVEEFENAVEDLEEAGWTKDSNTEAGTSRMAAFSKDTQTMLVMIDGSSDQISFTFGKS